MRPARIAGTAAVLFSAVLALTGQSKLAKPSASQLDWHAREIGAMICLGPQTWQGREYDDLSTPVSQIHPAKLDTEQWAETARSMGARYVVLVAKHTGGFCWWPTKTTNYQVGNTPLRGGKADVVADLARSCKRRGIGFGIYLSPQDAQFGAGVGGRCASPEQQRKYEQVFRQQLTELLTNYGSTMEVWFDGSLIFDVGDILRRHSPRAMIFQGPQATIRWTGNERGYAVYPLWNAVPGARAASGVATGADGDPHGDAWLPVECDVPTRNGWFWSPRNAGSLKTLAQYQAMYYDSVGRGANLLLNLTPDTSGLIPEPEVARAAEFGEWVKRSFDRPVAASNGTVLSWAKPTLVDHALLMEEIAEGQRIGAYEIEARVAGQWRKVATGQTVGYKRIERFPAVAATGLRVRATQSLAEPRWKKFAAYHLESAAPQTPRDTARVIEQPADRLQTSGALCRGGKATLDLTWHIDEAAVWQLELWERKQARVVKVTSAALRQGDREITSAARIVGEGAATQITINGLQERILVDLQAAEPVECRNLLVRMKPLH